MSSSETPGNDFSYFPAISADGRYVAFFSFATNLVASDLNVSCDPNGDGFRFENCPEVFIRDRLLGTTAIVSVGATAQGNGESYSPSISQDGRFDCDRDGYTGAVEAKVATSDQDPCGSNGWPSDLVPSVFNMVDMQDLGSFIAPVRRLGTSAGDPGYSPRWDLAPGATLGPAINVRDIVTLLSGPTGYPPMFGGLRAYGRVCPFPP